MGDSKDLEGAKTPIEVEDATVKEQEGKPTQVKVEPTARTYTQKEFDEAVGKAISSLQQQVSLKDKEIRKMKATVERAEAARNELQAEVEAARAEVERFLGEHDPEALDGYKQKKSLEALQRKLTMREKELAQKEQELTEREDELQATILTYLLERKANELASKYDVPRELLEECVSEEQMERLAKAFPEKGEEKTETPPAPKFDSNISSESGSLKGLSSREVFARWFRERLGK